MACFTHLTGIRGGGTMTVPGDGGQGDGGEGDGGEGDGGEGDGGQGDGGQKESFIVATPG